MRRGGHGVQGGGRGDDDLSCGGCKLGKISIYINNRIKDRKNNVKKGSFALRLKGA